MFNLRKKLDEYYEEAGKEDKLIFQLSKGQYNLQFKIRDTLVFKENNTPLPESPKLKQRIFKNAYLYYILGIGTMLTLVLHFSKAIKNEHYCWNDFFNNKTNLCVMADHTIVWHKYGSRLIPTIEQNINSEADYISYLQEHPNDSIKLADYTLFSKMAPFSIKTLTEWFLQNKSNFSLRLESRFEIDEIRDNNLLYIGQFKTMNTSDAIFLKNSTMFKVNSNLNGFIVDKENKEVEYNPAFKSGVQNKDYAMVSFMQLENRRKALFFVSNNDIGTMAVVNNFTDKEWLKGFYKNLPDYSSYFNALFEVSGVRRTEISCELVELEIIE